MAFVVTRCSELRLTQEWGWENVLHETSFVFHVLEFTPNVLTDEFSFTFSSLESSKGFGRYALVVVFTPRLKLNREDFGVGIIAESNNIRAIGRGGPVGH